ncbi:MAG: cytochrome c [Gemmatimonadetes bacterium]|nr:cytochrome c [Gemmatimonadota bacterium]
MRCGVIGMSGCLLALALTAGPAAAQAAQVPDGKTLFESQCKMCHGVRGVPPATMRKAMPALPTFDSAFIAARSNDSIVGVLKHGKGKNMKSFKDTLKPEEMAALARYVRSLGSKPRTPAGG